MTLHRGGGASNAPYGGAVSASGRPVHRRRRSLVLVWVGGSLGTGARYGLLERIPQLGRVPVGTLLVNVLGAFLLGLLLERLLRAGPDAGGRRDLRLLAGTGFLGGFTTYSTLATDVVGLLQAGEVGRATGYALATLLLGGLATALGVRCGGGSWTGRRS
jgi:CrcB protein